MGRDSSFSIKLNISRQEAFELVKKSLAKDLPPKIVNENEIMASPDKPNEINSAYYFLAESKIANSYFGLEETNPPKENECLISGSVVVQAESVLRRAVYAFKEHLEELGLEAGLKRFIKNICLTPYENGLDFLPEKEYDPSKRHITEEFEVD